MNAARIIVLILGIAILLINAALVITTLIVPRSASGLASLPMRVVRATFRRISLLARACPPLARGGGPLPPHLAPGPRLPVQRPHPGFLRAGGPRGAPGRLADRGRRGIRPDQLDRKRTRL